MTWSMFLSIRVNGSQKCYKWVSGTMQRKKIIKKNPGIRWDIDRAVNRYHVRRVDGYRRRGQGAEPTVVSKPTTWHGSQPAGTPSWTVFDMVQHGCQWLINLCNLWPRQSVCFVVLSALNLSALNLSALNLSALNLSALNLPHSTFLLAASTSMENGLSPWKVCKSQSDCRMLLADRCFREVGEGLSAGGCMKQAVYIGWVNSMTKDHLFCKGTVGLEAGDLSEPVVRRKSHELMTNWQEVQNINIKH